MRPTLRGGGGNDNGGGSQVAVVHIEIQSGKVQKERGTRDRKVSRLAWQVSGGRKTNAPAKYLRHTLKKEKTDLRIPRRNLRARKKDADPQERVSPQRKHLLLPPVS